MVRARVNDPIHHGRMHRELHLGRVSTWSGNASRKARYGPWTAPAPARAGLSPCSTPMDSRQRLVLALLRLNFASTVEDIAAWVALPHRKVREILDDLVAG